MFRELFSGTRYYLESLSIPSELLRQAIPRTQDLDASMLGIHGIQRVIDNILIPLLARSCVVAS